MGKICKFSLKRWEKIAFFPIWEVQAYNAICTLDTIYFHFLEYSCDSNFGIFNLVEVYIHEFKMYLNVNLTRPVLEQV